MSDPAPSKVPSNAPSKAPSVASQRRERSQTPTNTDAAHMLGPRPNPKDAAAEAFEREDLVISQYKLDYEAHLRFLRAGQLRREMATLDAETPRIVGAVREKAYIDIIEDRAVDEQMEQDARQQAEAYFIKYRTARGLGNLAKDARETITAMEVSLQKYAKMLSTAHSTAKDLLKLSGETADSAPRITFLTRVQPQWHLIYELIYARARQWLYAMHLYALLSDTAAKLSKSAVASRVRQEVNTLDVDMTDDDDDDTVTQDGDADDDSDDS